MNVFDYVTAQEIAAYIEKLPSNRMAFLGTELFPNKAMVGDTVSWLKGQEGLPVTIAPSQLDTKASLRERTGFGRESTELPFFREAQRIGERDRRELNRFAGRDLGAAMPIINNIFNGITGIVDGVEAQAEYMRMQLLQYGKFTVQSANAEAKYSYDYDKTTEHNFTVAALWTDLKTSNPIEDITAAQDKIEEDTGVRPTRIIMNVNTFNKMVASESIKRTLMIGVAGNAADLRVSRTQAQQFIEQETNSTIVVYSKKIAQFKDAESMPTPEYTKALPLIEDGNVVLMPDGNLGSTWHGTTPEADDLMAGNTAADVQVITNGPTITTYKEIHPVNVITVVSSQMVPSFEQIDNVGLIKAFG